MKKWELHSRNSHDVGIVWQSFSSGATAHTFLHPTKGGNPRQSRVHLGEPMSPVGVTYRRTVTATRMTQRQLHSHSAPPEWGTACRQLNRLKSVLPRCLSWSKPLPGSSAGVCFFQGAGLVSGSSLQLGLCESLCNFMASSGREGPSESHLFGGFSEAIIGCLPFRLRSFPAGWNVSVSDEAVTQPWDRSHSSPADCVLSAKPCVRLYWVQNSPCGPWGLIRKYNFRIPNWKTWTDSLKKQGCLRLGMMGQ